MNKLIIAGNGFDLAHGLPTSYNNFMDAFWRDLKENYEDDLVKEILHIDTDFFIFMEKEKVENFKGFGDLSIRFDMKTHFDKVSRGKWGNYRFKNQFFKELNETQSIQNWVDVENEYYQALKVICKNEKLETLQKREEVLKLHKEFEQVKQLLKLYLQKNISEAYDFENNNNDSLKFAKLLKPISISFDVYGNSIVDEFVTLEDQKFILDLQNKNKSKLNQTQILNFNYTYTFQRYLSLIYDRYPTVGINYIHGELNEDMVFGFGDEMDDDYKLIEDMDDNEYLRYFKSFQYVQNSNYKNVFQYIDSEKFQVIIMGHSCGLSDRTLLNTIFEHDNCRSIKVYYYKNDDYDNYTEIIQNISRHFNDKKLMRTKIVEKTLCEPMPQIQLPKKA